MRGFEAAPDLDRLVGPAVRVSVWEGDDTVSAPFRDEQHAVRRDVHEPRRREPFGEHRDLVSVGDDELSETS